MLGFEDSNAHHRCPLHSYIRIALMNLDARLPSTCNLGYILGYIWDTSPDKQKPLTMFYQVKGHCMWWALQDMKLWPLPRQPIRKRSHVLSDIINVSSKLVGRGRQEAFSCLRVDFLVGLPLADKRYAHLSCDREHAFPSI